MVALDRLGAELRAHVQREAVARRERQHALEQRRGLVHLVEIEVAHGRVVQDGRIQWQQLAGTLQERLGLGRLIALGVHLGQRLQQARIGRADLGRATRGADAFGASPQPHQHLRLAQQQLRAHAVMLDRVVHDLQRARQVVALFGDRARERGRLDVGRQRQQALAQLARRRRHGRP